METATPAQDISPRRSRPRRIRLFERERFEAAMAALRRETPDDAEFRRVAVGLFRATLAEGRARARALLEEDGSGLSCARRLSDLEDDIIRAMHAHVRRDLGIGGTEALAVVAVGGYGRGTLAPGSDIDLLFLVQPGSTGAERIVEAMLYILWDLKQKIGHATRTVEECLRQAKADMTIRTAVLDARLIDGDGALFDDMERRFDREIARASTRDFVAAKLAEREMRVRKAGESRYLVEPNVKEGKGGLRDLNTLFWIAKYVYRVEEAKELVGAGVFTHSELRLFRRCSEFLWCVRCHLHFITGRSEERLTFDQQRAIAGKLGYKSHAGLSAVERFMKHYFLIAKDVGDLTAILCAALEERQAKPRAVLDRLVGRLRRSSRDIEGSKDFAREIDRITVARDTVFAQDPVNLIRLFWLAARTGLAIHPHAMRLVSLALKHIDGELRDNPQANALFLDILTSRNNVEVVLRRMNEAGVLGRFIPDFGRIVAMMQFSMYHHYTVDEHLLRAVGVLAAIESGRLREDHPLASAVLPSVGDRTVLYVALFLHDIAKGREEDHSIAGADVARALCPRLGLDAAQTDTVVWLILEHLTMSNTAQSRDLGDPKTIETFAKIVQTPERLKLLLLLTICDIRAVGPGVWNGWKGQLLRTLYWETEVILTGGHSAIGRKARVAAAQEELRKALPNFSDPDFDAYAQRHYQAYWLKVDLPHKISHARLLHSMSVEIRSLATEVATDSFQGVTELTVVAPDHPRLLSIIAGACAAAGANIVDAQIFTTTDGLALDSIYISRAFDRDEDELRRAERVAAGIEKALRGQIKLSDAVDARGGLARGREAFTVVPDVVIDNSLSQSHTVLEVTGLDRPGFLYDLTRRISDLNLNIASAHIVTFGEKAVDVFYVTDLIGQKITNVARQQAIRRHLIEALGGTLKARPARAPERA